MISFEDEIDEVLNSEFATEAQVNGKIIKVIFHRDADLETTFEMRREAYNYWVNCKSRDVDDVKQNDKMLIDNVEYNVEYKMPDQYGWCKIILTK